MTTTESREVVLAVAKKVLQALPSDELALASDAPPAAWQASVIDKLQREHPDLPLAQCELQMQQIVADWQTFHGIVMEQRAEGR